MQGHRKRRVLDVEEARWSHRCYEGDHRYLTGPTMTIESLCILLRCSTYFQEPARRWFREILYSRWSPREDGHYQNLQTPVAEYSGSDMLSATEKKII